MLKQASEFWEMLFTIPRPPLDPNSLVGPEGYAVENPIYVPTVLSSEFEHLLDYFAIL